MDDEKREANTSQLMAKLRQSPEFARVAESLRDKPRREPFMGTAMSVEDFLAWAVARAISEPDVTETMTASERRKFAEEVKDATARLWGLLQSFSGESGMRYPFQPVFDRLALSV